MRQHKNTKCVTAAASEVNEVGMMRITMSARNQVVGWSLIFTLRDFRLFKNALHYKKQRANQLFGHVVHRQMLQPLIHLSAAPGAGRRHLKLTIESR